MFFNTFLKDTIVIFRKHLLFSEIMSNFIHKYTSVVRTFIFCRTDTDKNEDIIVR